MSKYLFVFNVVGLSPAYLKYLEKFPAVSKLLANGKKADMKPVFPCLTLPGQASISTGTYPCQHGIIANGFYYRDRLEVSFWDQHSSLVQKKPVWEKIKELRPDFKTALLFWQNTLYSKADIVITPKPIHADHKLIQWCYSKPVGLYEDIVQDIGPFELMNYWGPFASPESSRWIAKAAISTLRNQKPNFMMIYFPHLDYSCQKAGPEAPEVWKDLEIVDDLIGDFLNELDRMGIREESSIAILSEYSLSQVSGAICPNILLRKAGLLNVREIGGREYLDIEMSRAFAMVDHQIAHIYIKEKGDEDMVLNLLQSKDEIQFVLNKNNQKDYKINHNRSGELIAVTHPNKWFAYYWWEDMEKAPDFADKIDIHRKPGYDPLELFIDQEKMIIPNDTMLIQGSHGAPPKDGERMAVFLISGSEVEKMELPKEINMADVSRILQNIIIG